MEEFRIVFRDEQGNALSPEDLSDFSGPVGYQVVSDRKVPPEAQQLHEQGRAAGQQGEHEKALELFQQASKADPEWAYPLYDAAFAHLLSDDAAAAEQCYQRVDALAPRGFFMTKPAVDSLRREREGKITAGIYLAFVMLEWEQDAQKKAQTLMAMLKDSPAFPPGWQALATMLADPEEQAKAIENGLAHDPDAKTRGDLKIQKAILLARSAEKAQAKALLEALLADPECTIDAEAIGQIVLAQVESA